jgi:hypothetical protein
MSYAILRDAILNRKQVTCIYRSLYRELCPHVLGTGTDGRERVLAFQFAGESFTGLPAGGEWRCMRVDEMMGVASREGPWHTADNTLRPQTCVQNVDVEVTFLRRT